MRKLLIVIGAVAALALPAAASAHGHWWHHEHGLFAKLSGTGTSFSSNSATASGTIVSGSVLSAGTFNASLTTDWSKAETKNTEHGTLSCAPSSVALTLVDSASSSNTATSTVTGKTCSFTKSDGTVVRGFFGKGSVTGAGTLGSLAGMERVFLMQKADGTVHGAAFAGFGAVLGAQFTAREHTAEHQDGDCAGHH